MIDDPATRLRDLPADVHDPDPRFLDRLHDELARELGLSARRVVPVSGVAAPAPARLGPLTRPGARSTRLLLAAALVVIGTIGGALLAGAPAPSTPADLLAEVRAREELRVGLPAIVHGDGEGVATFNQELAMRLGERLGIPTSVVEDPGIQAPTDWDVAIAEALGPVDLARFATSAPIYHAPVYLEVRADLTFAELDGLRACAIERSVGAAWLAGDPGIESSTPVAPLPAQLSVTLKPMARDCIAGLETRWDLWVTAGLRASQGGLGRTAVGPNSEGWRLGWYGYLGDPVLTLPIPLVAPRDGPDPTSLLALVDTAIAGLREDGTLADLSRDIFSRRDLSVPPSTDGRHEVEP